jgi:hypothetical protein
MGGASKCYKEVKKVSPTAKNFSVMHMKSNEIYDFNINNFNQTGGGPNDMGGTNASLSDLELLRNQMSSIEKRIIAIENKLNMPNINEMNNMNDNMNDNMNNNMNDNMNNNMTNFSPNQNQQKPIQQLMQQNMPNPTMNATMKPTMNATMKPTMNPTINQTMNPTMIQKPNLVNGQQFGNGFDNQSTKASAFYSAARDFV